MQTDMIITLIGAGLSITGSAALFIVRMRKAANEKKILKEEKAKEVELRKKEERDKFYLLTASNLVMSAERLNLTGPQKKEYVMTWLENETIKAGMAVDKAVMSVAIERAVLLMNDHRHVDAPFVNTLDADLKEQVAEEQKRIKSETEKALAENETNMAKTEKILAEGSALSETTLTEVKNLLTKSHKFPPK